VGNFTEHNLGDFDELDQSTSPGCGMPTPAKIVEVRNSDEPRLRPP
jgi:hypothetical protein